MHQLARVQSNDSIELTTLWRETYYVLEIGSCTGHVIFQISECKFRLNHLKQSEKSSKIFWSRIHEQEELHRERDIKGIKEQRTLTQNSAKCLDVLEFSARNVGPNVYTWPKSFTERKIYNYFHCQIDANNKDRQG
jgi:hypothetical protein